MKTMTPDTKTKPPETEPDRRDRPGLVAVVVAMVVLAAALLTGVVVATRDSGPSPATVGSDQDPLAPVSPPAAAVPEPTTLATVPVADTVDFTAVVQGIVQASNDLRIHPDPGALLTFMESGNTAYGDALAGQSQLITGALRYDPAPATPVVSKVRVIARDPDLAVVNVTFASIPRYRVVDRSGQVVSDAPAAADVSVQWKLHRTNGTWRLVGAQTI